MLLFRKASNLFSRGVATLNRVMSPRLHIFGSGLMNPPTPDKFQCRNGVFWALRGRRTVMALSEYGLPAAYFNNTVLCDPGIFAPDVIPLKDNTPNYPIGCIPHAIYWKDKTVDLIKQAWPDLRMIDPRNPPTEVINEIAACQMIVSSSLHGLIVADALQKPNLWVTMDTDGKKLLGRFKFDDYYSAFGIQRNPIHLRDLTGTKFHNPINASTLSARKREFKDLFKFFIKESA